MCDVTCTTAGGNRQPWWQPTTAGDAVSRWPSQPYTVMMLIFSTQATVKTISDGLYTPLWCYPCSPHTHTHTTRYVQNSAFEQSIANTWTNNKTYLQSLIQKRQIVIAKSEFTLFFFLFFIAFVHSQPCTLLGSRNSSIKCAAKIRTFGLCCSVVNKS